MLLLFALLVSSASALVNSFSRPSLRLTKMMSVVEKAEMEKPLEELPEEMEPYLENPYYLDGDKPASAWNLGVTNFLKQGSTILGQLAEQTGLKESDPTLPPQCLNLVLSNEAVKKAERKREENGGRVDAHPASRALYDAGCFFLDNFFEGRPIPRFWFLETVARIPYFSYVSMLHLYESLGWWRATELRKIHGAEEYNELHHLLICEALGGNARWSDRFIGQHAAIVYYWMLIGVYLFSPRVAYEFMELLEAHAVDTYGTFVKQNRQKLKKLPPPIAARTYYGSDDLYMFDDFQVGRTPGSRRPPCDNLLDVFQNICEDEAEHVKTMQACQVYASTGKPIISPHLEAERLKKQPLSTEQRDQEKRDKDEKAKRALWKKWAEDVTECENPSEFF